MYFSLFANSPSYGGHSRSSRCAVNGEDVKPMYEEDDSAMKIDLAQPLLPGESIEIEMDYTAQVPT